MAIHAVNLPTLRRPLAPTLNLHSPLMQGLLLCVPGGRPYRDFADISPYRRAATLLVAPTETIGHPELGLGTDFSTDIVEYADTPDWDTTTVTAACWVRTDTATSQLTPFGRCTTNFAHQGDWVLSLAPLDGSTYRFGLINSGGLVSAESTFGFSTTRPALLVGVMRDGTTAELYVNGLLQATATGAGTYPGTAALVRIGSRQGGSFPWNGQIWDCFLWNRALSPQEIWSLYDPMTRWNIYAPTQRRAFVEIAVAPGGFVPFPPPRGLVGGAHVLSGGMQ